jgi:hypothetical protein
VYIPADNIIQVHCSVYPTKIAWSFEAASSIVTEEAEVNKKGQRLMLWFGRRGI